MYPPPSPHTPPTSQNTAPYNYVNTTETDGPSLQCQQNVYIFYITSVYGSEAGLQFVVVAAYVPVQGPDAGIQSLSQTQSLVHCLRMDSLPNAESFSVPLANCSDTSKC